MEKNNELSIRVYYEDTDCGNMVYYANYLRYMERGRTELLRGLGVDFSKFHENDTVFTVIEANVKYKHPARYDDLLTVITNVKEMGGASLTFETEIRRGETLLVYGDIKLACIKFSTGTPRRVPAEIIKALQ